MANPHASNEDVVKALGVASRSVTNARAALVAQGIIQRSYFDRQHRPAGPTEPGPEPSPGPNEATLPLAGPRDAAAFAKAILEDRDPALTVDQMRQRYSAIARYGQRSGEFTLEIQAMQALGRLDSTTGVRDRLGPGVPHTREQRRDRVVPILDAAGPSIVAEALMMAFEPADFQRFIDELGRFMARKADNGQPTAENSPQSTETSAPAREIPSESVAEPESIDCGADDSGKTGPTEDSSGGIAVAGGDPS